MSGFLHVESLDMGDFAGYSGVMKEAIEAVLNIGNRTLIRRSEIVSLSLVCQDEIKEAFGGLSLLMLKTEHQFSFALRLTGGVSIDLPIISHDKEAVLSDWASLSDWFVSGNGEHTLKSEATQ
jgi:hypothetical protein